MSARSETPPAYRVVYVGTGRRGSWMRQENERAWRTRQASVMEAVCREMVREGLRLFTVVPVKSSGDFKEGWTEGAWLYFSTA